MWSIKRSSRFGFSHGISLAYHRYWHYDTLISALSNVPKTYLSLININQDTYLPTYLHSTRNIFKATHTSTYSDDTHPPLPLYSPTTNNNDNRPAPNETQRRRWWRRSLWRWRRSLNTILQLCKLENRGCDRGLYPGSVPATVHYLPVLRSRP